MSIINILKYNTSPNDTEALFQTLVSTSEAIEKQNSTTLPIKEVLDKKSEEEVLEEQNNDLASPSKKDKKEPAVTYEKQLQLLLENLSKNEKLNFGKQ